MNVQEVMSPTSIVGNAAIESVDSVSGTKVFFEIKVAIAKVAPYAVFVGKRISGFRYAEEAEISSRVAIDINQWLREVCTAKLLQTQIILGGPGVVVQIAESLFRHKPKVGRKPVQLSNGIVNRASGASEAFSLVMKSNNSFGIRVLTRNACLHLAYVSPLGERVLNRHMQLAPPTLGYAHK